MRCEIIIRVRPDSYYWHDKKRRHARGSWPRPRTVRCCALPRHSFTRLPSASETRRRKICVPHGGVEPQESKVQLRPSMAATRQQPRRGAAAAAVRKNVCVPRMRGCFMIGSTAPSARHKRRTLPPPSAMRVRAKHVLRAAQRHWSPENAV